MPASGLDGGLSRVRRGARGQRLAHRRGPGAASRKAGPLDLGAGFGLADSHRGRKRGVVAFVLVGVGFGEFGDRLVELAEPPR